MERNDLVELSRVTSAYLERHFSTLFLKTEYDMVEFTTTLLTHEKKVESSQVTLKLRSSALFGPDSFQLPTESLVAKELAKAFSATMVDGYLGMVQALPRKNIFSSTLDVRMDFEKLPDSTKNRTTAVIWASLASILAFGAATGYLYRRCARHGLRNLENLKDESTVSITVGTVSDEMSITILKTPPKKSLDFDFSTTTPWEKNWWGDDVSNIIDLAGELDENSISEGDKARFTKRGTESAESPRGSSVWEKKTGDPTYSTARGPGGTNPFDPIRLEDCEPPQFFKPSLHIDLSEESDYLVEKVEGLRSLIPRQNPGMNDFRQRRSRVPEKHIASPRKERVRLANHISEQQDHVAMLQNSTPSQSLPEDYLLSRLRGREYLDDARSQDPPIYERVGDRKRNIIARRTGREPSGVRRKDPSA